MCRHIALTNLRKKLSNRVYKIIVGGSFQSLSNSLVSYKLAFKKGQRYTGQIWHTPKVQGLLVKAMDLLQ